MSLQKLSSHYRKPIWPKRRYRSPNRRTIGSFLWTVFSSIVQSFFSLSFCGMSESCTLRLVTRPLEFRTGLMFTFWTIAAWDLYHRVILVVTRVWARVKIIEGLDFKHNGQQVETEITSGVMVIGIGHISIPVSEKCGILTVKHKEPIFIPRSFKSL